jgi:hypothetical protein
MGVTKTSEPAARAIPGVILQFLDRASVALGCTADRDRLPTIHWVSGWQADADQKSLWCFVPREFEAGLRQAIAAKGRFSMTVEHIGPHECYQFKGRILEARPATEADAAVVARCRERFAAAVRQVPQFAGHEAALRRYILDAVVAVRVAVHEIFLQTPGPGAGSLLARLENPS